MSKTKKAARSLFSATTSKQKQPLDTTDSNGSTVPSLQRLKALERDFSSFEAQLGEVVAILGDTSLLTSSSDASGPRRSNFHGRGDWALRWILKKLREDTSNTVRYSAQAWIFVQNLIKILPVVVSARVLTTGHFLESVAASLPQLTVEVSSNHTSSESKGKKKRKLEDSEGSQTKKRRLSATEAVTSSNTAVSVLHLPVLSACLELIYDAALQASSDRNYLHAEYLRSVLRAPESLAARILSGWLLAVESETLSPRSKSPFTFIWENRLTIANEQKYGIPRDFASRCFGPLIACLTKDRQVGSGEVSTIQNLLAKHMILPARETFLRSGSKDTSHLRELLVFAGNVQERPGLDEPTTALFRLFISCSKTLQAKLSPIEHQWLEHVFSELCIYSGLKAAEDDSFSMQQDGRQHSHTNDQRWTQLKEMLRVALQHGLRFSQTLLAQIFVDSCRPQAQSLERNRCELAALIVQLDGTLFVPSPQPNHEALQVLDQLLREISGQLRIDFRTGRPSLGAIQPREQEIANETAPLSTHNGPERLYHVVLSDLLIPLLRSFAAARQLRAFLKVWVAGLVEAFDTEASGTPQLSIWEDEALIEEFCKHSKLAFTSKDLVGLLDEAASAFEPQSDSAQEPLLAESWAVISTVLLRSLKSTDIAESVMQRLISLRSRCSQILKAATAKPTRITAKAAALLSLMESTVSDAGSDIAHLSESLSQVASILKVSTKTSKMNGEQRGAFRSFGLPLATIALAWLDTLAFLANNVREKSPEGSKELMRTLDGVVSTVFNSDVWNRNGSDKAENAFADLLSLYPGLLGHIQDPNQRTSVLKTSLKIDHDCTDMVELDRHLQMGRLCCQNLAVRDDDVFGTYIHTLEALTNGEGNLQDYALMYHALPVKRIPRRLREKLLDALMDGNDFNKLEKRDCLSRLAIILKLVGEPFGKAKLASNIWSLLDQIYEPESPRMPILARNTFWRGIATRIILRIVADHPTQPPCSSGDKRRFWSKVFAKEGDAYLAYTNEEELQLIRRCLRLDDSASPQAESESGLLGTLKMDPVSSCTTQMQSRKQFLNRASKQTETSRDDFLKARIDEFLEESMEEAAAMSIAAIYGDHQLSEHWVTSKHVPTLALALCRTSRAARSLESFGYANAALCHLLAQAKSGITQHIVEEVLRTVCAIATEQRQALKPELAAVVFSRLVKTVHILLTSHRRHVNGRLHLLMPTLQALLRCFFVADTVTGSDNKLQLPSWAARDGRALTAGDADDFSRLITLVTEPSASASRGRTGKQQSLVDEIARAKGYAGEQMGWMIQEWAECNLKGRLVQSDGVREALMAALWSILNCVPPETLQSMADGMRSDGKAIVKALRAEWVRVGGGQA